MPSAALPVSPDAALLERLAELEGRIAELTDALETLPARIARAAPAPGMLTADALAERLSVSRRTVDSLDSCGELPPSVRIGRQRRWDRGTVETWIRNRAVT